MSDELLKRQAELRERYRHEGPKNEIVAELMEIREKLTYPHDEQITKAAWRIIDEHVQGDKIRLGSDLSPLRLAIEEAILAERKRCAALARAKAAEWRAFGNGLRENSADGRTDGADRQMQAQAAAGDAIARAIEEGRQP